MIATDEVTRQSLRSMGSGQPNPLGLWGEPVYRDDVRPTSPSFLRSRRRGVVMRDMLFVGHANPEDNEIARWLALRLATEGYPVWCDLTKLLGGEAFWSDIESAIRERTSKYLLVLSRTSNAKPGVLNELSL